MISMPLTELDRRAKSWALSIDGFAKVIDGESLIGGGSLPGASLPTRLLAIGNVKNPVMALKVARSLRLQETPVIGRISDSILLLDPRTVFPEEDEIVVSGLIKSI
jgi:L-seryl-tRNA(Ser) seleniumtransferase